MYNSQIYRDKAKKITYATLYIITKLLLLLCEISYIFSFPLAFFIKILYNIFDMKNFTITSARALCGAAVKLGFLPFFQNSIKGFSVAEHCPPKLWFTDVPGPWEWKGPVIKTGRCAYGKFFKNKAVYVSLDMLPHLCNYRRDGYDFDARCDDDLVFYRDKEIYEIIQKSGKITSKDLKKKLGDDKNTDKYLTRLQMQTYIVISDFIYERSKDGAQYGWGIAEYTTPEFLYGRELVTSQYKTKPETSLQIMADTICKNFPEADRQTVIKLIK